jgi:dienelactone hydrolase
MNGIVLLGEGLRERFAEDLESFGYTVKAVEVVASIDDIAEAILDVKQMASGGIGAIAIGPLATLLLEAATVLPQLDGIVLFGGTLPAARPHYARMRSQVQIHIAAQAQGSFSADDVERLREESSRGHVLVFDWTYETANERFVVAPKNEQEASDAEIAWDRVRDFLTGALPVVEGA